LLPASRSGTAGRPRWGTGRRPESTGLKHVPPARPASYGTTLAYGAATGSPAGSQDDRGDAASLPATESVPSPAAEPTQRVRKPWIAVIALTNLGLFLGYLGPISVVLPNQVQAIASSAHKVALLG
jgi:hypothetical protein